MIKQFMSLALIATTTFAGIVGGVSMTVDSEPITLYEIQNFVQQNKVSTEEAINRLIQQKIEDIEIKNLGLVVPPNNIDMKMEDLAKQNKMSLEKFKQELVKEGHSETTLRDQIEQKLKRDELYKKIVGSSLKKPDEEELVSFYELHKDEFSAPTTVDVIEFLSPSKEALEVQKKQPMAQQQNVQATQKTVKLQKINPQLAQLLMQTPEGTFTPVLSLGKIAGMFFVQKKGGKISASYDKMKPTIFAMVMKSKEQASLIEHFEKKKSEANIKIIRRPN